MGVSRIILNPKSYYYIYQVNFSDGTYYIGSRKSCVSPELDTSYWGSPVTHKLKWKDQDLIKEKIIIKSGFKSYESMRLFEIELIKSAWKIDRVNNLNENCGGSFSEQSCKLGGKLSSLLVEFTDPDGNVHVHYGINAFCRNNDLDQSHVVGVLKGRHNHHKGWTAKYLSSDGTEFINVNMKPINKENEKKLVEFTDPKGNIYIHRGVREFCRNNNLTATNMVKVLKGKYSHHKKWTAKYLKEVEE